MLRERKAPAGPRTDFSSSTSKEPFLSSGRPRQLSGREPTMHASTRNNHSLFWFGGDTNGGSYDFLPSPSFDDLQSSITGASNTFKAQTEETKPETTFDKPRASMDATSTSTIESRSSIGGRGSLGPRPSRTGSLVRRQSNSARQSSLSSTASSGSGSMDPPNAPMAMRNRRQSQYPPVSGSSLPPGAARYPRKSIGPGVIDIDTSAKPRQRGGLSASTSTNSLADLENGSNRMNIAVGAPSYTDGARGLTASRAAKTKSLQPAVRPAPVHLSVNTQTPEQRSPSNAKGRGGNTPLSASAKRASMMPGSHATGLGARTISPTDARRAKRMSVMPNPPPMPDTPPTPQPDFAEIRPSSKSPSMLPRKVATPSSSRTTPDINRKSYSSGLSVASNTSHNTSRTSTGSLQPRVPLLAPNSKLPTPKTRNLHSSAGDHEDEEVPPVPAIPKAYESPKDNIDLPFSAKLKPSVPAETSSLTSNSSTSLTSKSAYREPSKQDRDAGTGNHEAFSSLTCEPDQTTSIPPVRKKNLQPLRLPPFNLLPLSTPTADKIAALQDPKASTGTVTPPPRRSNAKTPSSPMTASKTSLFSRKRSDEKAEMQSAMRSTTSIEPLNCPSPRDPELSRPIPMSPSARYTVSPFVSSSLPKQSDEHFYPARSMTTNDFLNGPPVDLKPPTSRLTGPRAHKLTKPRPEPQLSSPEEPQTPTSGTSLRRKLSLGWKRSASKASLSQQGIAANATSDRESEYPPQPPKHDNMPPPRLPASATVNNLSTLGKSPSPSLKTTTYLDSKRRKSSTSSLSMFGHDRTRSDSWGINRSPKKESTPESDRQTPTRSTVMQKGPKSMASTLSMRSKDRWTIDLDKDDLLAEDEMKKLGSRKKEIEQAAREVDALTKRATPKEPISIHQVVQNSSINLYERGEIIDFDHVYFCGTPHANKHIGDPTVDALNFGYDDDRGDYHIIKGDHLSYRYEIVDVLGKGSFGQVVRCIDHKVGNLVAVKIIRNKKRFHAQALVEVNILKKLRDWDPQRKHSIINFVQSFYFRNHLCISTELLDVNLYEWIKTNSFRGFSLNIVRRMARQLLSTLVLLKQHRVIHCDLKPENILLAHPLHSEIKVIDFGSSCFENEKVYTYIQSRFYRSPEVILGMTYGMPIDMWSLGCILAEIYTGVPIFPGENELEQLACIMEVFGPPERHLIEKSSRRKLFFDSLGKPRINVSSKGRRRRPSSKTLQQAIKCDDEAFIDFLKQSLRWDQDRRLKPDEAIRHPFITGQKMMTPSVRMQARVETSPIRRHNSIATAGTFSSSTARLGAAPDLKKPQDDSLGPRIYNRTIANFGNSVAAAASSSKRDYEKINENFSRSEIASANPVDRVKHDNSQLYDAGGLRVRSGTNRPLPEPPVEPSKSNMNLGPKEPPRTNVLKYGRRQSSLPDPPSNDSNLGFKDSAGPSPAKPSSTRRHSNINGLNSSVGNKRSSIGSNMATGNSSLPRAARTFSGPRLDLASAGATAAMARRP